MRNRRQHIVSLLFTAIILFPLLAITFLQVTQAYIKSNRGERLNSEKLVQVILPARDVIWEEEGREVWVGNRMFDVASFSIIKDSYYLNGVYDDDETVVAGSLVHSLLSNGGKNILHLLLLLQCFTCSVLLIYSMKNCLQSVLHFLHHFICLPHPCFLVLSPPPQG